MKLNRKNRIIVAVSGLALLTGITYQNCGQIKQTSVSEENKSKSVFLQSLQAGETKELTITLKDGTQIKTELHAANPLEGK